MHAKLTLDTQIRQGKTTLKNCFVTPPLKLLPLPTQADGMLRAVQMSASPGLLAGDIIETEIEVCEHGALSLFTQAFTRVLSMREGDKAEQRTHIRMQPHSRLCFLPHPLVLHEGSTLIQTTDIDLGDHCNLLYGEIIAAGRVLRDEKFAFARLSSHLNIRHHGREWITDNIQWQLAHYPLNVIGQMEGYTHQLNLFYADSGKMPSEIRAQVDDVYAALSESFADSNILWGVTQANEQVLCLRALANNAQDLQQLLQAAVGQLHSGQITPQTAVFFR
ncbi:urease accessory protein UreD [Neisseria perflava]|uniref:urease accessory protein UreD n=1 Tax=Neisseria perflava TaxID=33053 RepID=UPI00209CBD2F|nr:urease accessory protein UreD [Neisseria perflava]MCP1661056.1 urease accessory protein [Neisseria perflava]MCP1772319.1 urease accessory protein [Neisseria perflava]